MSDPTHPTAAARFRSPFRSLVLDPALLFGRVLSAEALAVAVACEAGGACGRIFTPLVTVATSLCQVLSDGHSCRAAVARLLAWRAARGPPSCSPDTGASCKARRRLPESLLPRLVRRTADRLGDRAPEGGPWRGRRVPIADGTCASMPDTPEDQAAYPRHGSQRPGCGSPIARIVALLSPATGAVTDAAVGPREGKLSGGDALLRALHGRVRPGDVVLADRHFSSFHEVAVLPAAGADVVMRRHAGRSADFRRGTRPGREDHLVARRRRRGRPGWMTRAGFAALPRGLTLRGLRVRVERRGFRTRSLGVVTSLLDPAEYPRDAIAAAYRRRWDAELDIRGIKRTMRMDVLRCKAPETVVKGTRAHLPAYNPVRGVTAGAADRHGVSPRELSLRGARQTIGALRGELSRAGGGAADDLVAAALEAIADHRVGDRPGRVGPRVVKRRPRADPRMHEPRQPFKQRVLGAA